MPRRAGPWYRTARRQWFAEVSGRQFPLGIFDPADRAGAEAAFQKLLATSADYHRIRAHRLTLDLIRTLPLVRDLPHVDQALILLGTIAATLAPPPDPAPPPSELGPDYSRE